MNLVFAVDIPGLSADRDPLRSRKFEFFWCPIKDLKKTVEPSAVCDLAVRWRKAGRPPAWAFDGTGELANLKEVLW